MTPEPDFDHYYGWITHIDQQKKQIRVEREDGASFQVSSQTLYGSMLPQAPQVGQLVRISFEEDQLVAARRLVWPNVKVPDWKRFLRYLRAALRYTPDQAQQWLGRLTQQEQQNLTEREIQLMLASDHPSLREWGVRLSPHISQPTGHSQETDMDR